MSKYIYDAYGIPHLNPIQGGGLYPEGDAERVNQEFVTQALGQYVPPRVSTYNPNQTPIGSMGLFGVPQTGSQYGGTDNMLGGNFHNAMGQAMQGNAGQLQGLLSPGTSAKRKGRLTYNHTGE